MSRKKTFVESLEEDENRTKEYIFTTGKHIDSEGNEYKKGDRITLTEEEAKGLVNKILDPSEFGVSQSVNTEDVQALKNRIEELELENSQLKEAFDGDA